VRKIEGNFCSRFFLHHQAQNLKFFKEGGESNRDWFSLKLKLDDFTSGFRTRYADTAGGCEEVVAVGGGIRTGTGTGVELEKQNEVDGAAEGKIVAGGSAAEQANCIF
jgi:hypothetical protein